MDRKVFKEKTSLTKWLKKKVYGKEVKREKEVSELQIEFFNTEQSKALGSFVNMNFKKNEILNVPV